MDVTPRNGCIKSSRKLVWRPVTWTLAVTLAAWVPAVAVAGPQIPIELGWVPNREDIVVRTLPADLPGYGGLDLELNEEDALVFVDEQPEPVGRAGDFDGRPGFLWLPKGVYHLVFYKPDFETRKVTVNVSPGVVTRYELELEPGTSARREDLAAGRGVLSSERSGSAPALRHDPGGAVGREAGQLDLVVRPAGSRVLLDGRSVPCAGPSPCSLSIGPGRHRVVAHHPGFKRIGALIAVRAGEVVRLELVLEPRRPVAAGKTSKAGPAVEAE